jgi:SAM-dependent methyltransferase
VGSDYDDELWRLAGDDPGPPPAHLTEFVASLPAVRRALDLGCGDGRLSAAIPAEELTAADVSRVALERARTRVPDARLVELEPDAPLPLEDNAFELVLCAETLEHVRDVQLLVSEARRVLVPGGTLAVTTPGHGRLSSVMMLARGIEHQLDPRSPHIRHFSARSLRVVLDDGGFDVRSLERHAGTLLAIATR